MTTRSPARSGARLLVDQLLLQGVERAFCVPGESYLSVLDELYAVRERLALTVNRHESGAAFMAEAWGKLTGHPGVCFVTRGPGATNASGALHTAFQDSTPMVLFVGQVGSDFMDREAFQEIDYRRFFGQVTKWTAQIERADRVPEYVARAFQVATSGRPGPVVLALPEDMQDATAQVEDAHRHHPVSAGPTAESLTALHARLGRAQRPMVLVGGSGWTPDACSDLEHFLAANHLPAGCVFRRQDLIDNHHPNYIGDVGIGINPRLAERVREADVLLAFGTRLGEMTTSGYSLIQAPVPRQALIHAHPDPDELGRVYQPAVAIAAGMPKLMAALRRLDPIPTPVWAASVKAGRAEYEAWQREPGIFTERPESLNLWRVVQTLFEQLPADTLLANGAGNFATWGHRFHRYQGFAKGARTQLAPTSGTMGYGLPAGIAAKLHNRAQAVVVFAGDGEFLMTGQELACAVAERAAILILVFNNGMYGTIRMHQERTFPGRTHGTALANPDFAAYARAFGAYGARVASHAEFESALSAALEHMEAESVPALIELAVDAEIITPQSTISSLRKAQV